MTVLSYQSIRRLCAPSEYHPPLITNSADVNFCSASYDLRVGSEYSLSYDPAEGLKAAYINPSGIRYLNSSSRFIVIPPHHAVVVKTHEELTVPARLVGHLSLKLDVLLKGLIMANQSQVDAGYRGYIFVLLYNLNAKTIKLEYLDSLVRIEFAKLDAVTLKPYEGDYKEGYGIRDVLEEPISTALAVVVRRFEDQLAKFKVLRRRLKKFMTRVNWSLVVGSLAIMVAGATLYVTALTPFMNDAAHAQQQTNDTAAEVASLRQAIDDQRGQIAGLQAELRQLRATIVDEGGRP